MGDRTPGRLPPGWEDAQAERMSFSLPLEVLAKNFFGSLAQNLKAIVRKSHVATPFDLHVAPRSDTGKLYRLMEKATGFGGCSVFFLSVCIIIIIGFSILLI